VRPDSDVLVLAQPTSKDSEERLTFGADADPIRHMLSREAQQVRRKSKTVLAVGYTREREERLPQLTSPAVQPVRKGDAVVGRSDLAGTGQEEPVASAADSREGQVRKVHFCVDSCPVGTPLQHEGDAAILGDRVE
jgi:hypothetical protein